MEDTPVECSEATEEMMDAAEQIFGPEPEEDPLDKPLSREAVKGLLIQRYIEANKDTMNLVQLNRALKKNFGVQFVGNPKNKYFPHIGKKQREKAELRMLRKEQSEPK